jgi:hypothetical protein
MVLALLAAECMMGHHRTTQEASATATASGSRITVVERCSVSYKASEALLAANQHMPGAGLIHLLPVPLASLKNTKATCQSGQETRTEPFFTHEGGPADVLVTDLVDHT